MNGSGPDPLFCYEKWLEIEREKNVRSTFLFLPEDYSKRHYSDGGYRYDDVIVFDREHCTVGEMIREIRTRGWEIGLHGSWHSAGNAKIFLEEKQRLEDVAGEEIVSSRQHNLHFDIRITPRILMQSGIQVDSSIGFNDACGFRYGTSVPWGLQGANADSVLELPMCIQDKVIMKIVADTSFETALDVAGKLIAQASAEGGVLCLLWHPRTIQWPHFIKMYELLIDLLHQEGAWFGTMRDVQKQVNSSLTFEQSRREVFDTA